MASWKPTSYIAEVMGNVMRRQSKDTSHGDTTSYYDFTANVFKKSETSDAIRQALNEDYYKCFMTSKIIAGERVALYLKEKNSTTAGLFDTNAIDLNETIPREVCMYTQQMTEAENALPESFPCRMPHAGVKINMLQPLVVSRLTELLEGSHVRDAMIACGSFYSVLPGCSWGVGIPGAPFHDSDDEKVLIKYASLSRDSASLMCSSVLHFSEGGSIRLTLLGDNILQLTAVLDRFFACTSVSQCLECAHLFLQLPWIHDFYCDGSTGFFVSRESLQESTTEEEAPSSNPQLWNMKAHLLQAVKGGKSADAFHLLEGTRNNELLNSTLQFIRHFPRYTVEVSQEASSGNILFQEISSFQFLGDTMKKAFFPVRHCSPLHNHVCSIGAVCTLHFYCEPLNSDIASCLSREECTESAEGGVRCFVRKGQGNVRVAEFKTSQAIEIGDCSLIIGTLKIEANAQFPLVREREPSPIFVNTGQRFTTPFLCTTLHGTYGMVGFVGCSFVLSSNYPPTLAVISPLHNSEFPLNEDSIDPNFTVYFFRQGFQYFEKNSYKTAFSQLPFSLTDKKNMEEGQFSAKLRCRLLHIIQLEEVDSVMCVLAVSRINELDCKPVTHMY